MRALTTREPEVLGKEPSPMDRLYDEDEYRELKRKAIYLDRIVQAQVVAEDCANRHKLTGADKALYKMAFVEGFSGAKDWPVLDKFR